MDNSDTKHIIRDVREFGFELVGEWVLYPKINSGIDFRISRYKESRVIYSFVVNDVPKYIGICEKDSTNLTGRLNRYKSMAGDITNRRIAGKIKECLELRLEVKIFALIPREEFIYNELVVDTIKGLENPLIRICNPEWNLRK